ncbi:hypothetical protein ACX9I7_00790 [Streptomyces sp. L500]
MTITPNPVPLPPQGASRTDAPPLSDEAKAFLDEHGDPGGWPAQMWKDFAQLGGIA